MARCQQRKCISGLSQLCGIGNEVNCTSSISCVQCNDTEQETHCKSFKRGIDEKVAFGLLLVSASLRFISCSLSVVVDWFFTIKKCCSESSRPHFVTIVTLESIAAFMDLATAIIYAVYNEDKKLEDIPHIGSLCARFGGAFGATCARVFWLILPWILFAKSWYNGTIDRADKETKEQDENENANLA
uniref:uncharacterized protein LOC120336055 n=1 Tax=Styela clava TaxID=7725 RepID=UPI00193A0BDF|nr:uncharacterized protein LOC120336055 [Styela clava]